MRLSRQESCFEFANTQQIWKLKVGLIDREVVKIQVGDTAQVFFDAFPGTPFRAFISLIPNAPNPVNGTYEVEIGLMDYEPRLRSGFYAKINIFPSQRNSYAIIPLLALVEGDGREGIVYSPEGERVVTHKVRVEEFVEGEIAVSGDVKGLEYVITDGVQDLTANSEIEIVQ